MVQGQAKVTHEDHMVLRRQNVRTGRVVMIRDHGSDRARRFRFVRAALNRSGEVQHIDVIDPRTGAWRSFTPDKVRTVKRQPAVA